MSQYLICNVSNSPVSLSGWLSSPPPKHESRHQILGSQSSPYLVHMCAHVFTSTYMYFNSVQCWSVVKSDGIMDIFILCNISKIYLHCHRWCYYSCLLGAFVLCECACLFSCWWGLSCMTVSTVVVTEATNPLTYAPSCACPRGLLRKS